MARRNNNLEEEYFAYTRAYKNIRIAITRFERNNNCKLNNWNDPAGFFYHDSNWDIIHRVAQFAEKDARYKNGYSVRLETKPRDGKPREIWLMHDNVCIAYCLLE